MENTSDNRQRSRTNGTHKRREHRRPPCEPGDPNEKFSFEKLKSTLAGLKGMEFKKRALDLMEACAAFSDAEMAYARTHLCDHDSFSQRDFTAWRRGVVSTQKKRERRAKERARSRDEKRKDRQREQIKENDLPLVELSNRHGRDVKRDVEGALEAYNESEPRLFLQDGRSVQVQLSKGAAPRITTLSVAAFSDHIGRAANVVRSTKEKVKPADLPERYVRQLLSRDDLPFQTLRGVTEIPVMRPDGTILDEPGYDERTALYYKPSPDFDMPDVSDCPSEKEIEQAKQEIHEPLQDFPFVSATDYANMVGLLLTRPIKPLIHGANVPLAGIDAPTRGSGKSLLADVVADATTGREMATTSQPSREEEWRKQITSLLVSGAQYVCIDNVKGRLKSSALERALTEDTWKDRVLGQSKMAEVPQNAVWIATGNNLQPADDMERRCYMIRIDPEQERPWQGRSFKHEDLRKYVRENRGNIVWALLTLARAWVAEGKPKPQKVEPLGSFEAWTITVGGILEKAGVEGFLGNLEDLWDSANPEEVQWKNLFEALHGHYGDETFFVRELAEDLKDEYRDHGYQKCSSMRAVIEFLPERTTEQLQSDKGRASISRSIGKFFSHRKGRRYGPKGWRVETCGKVSRSTKWRVACGDEN